MPGQYGSNGINSDGSLMNVGNKLGDRASIKLFPQYSSGDTMRALLADCGGLGDASQASPPQRPAAIDQNAAPQAQSPPHQHHQHQQRHPHQYPTIPFRPAAGGGAASGAATPAAAAPIGASNAFASSLSLTSAAAASPHKMSALEAQRSLWDAARQGNTQLVRAALADGADPMLANPTDGRLALHYAASGNRRLTCQLLLSMSSAAAQCATRDKTGRLPVQVCSQSALKELIDAAVSHAR
jgi:hypothetical protein